MREEPPQGLIGLLEELGLATGDQVRGTGRRVARLARGLPLFESVWVDALAQARILTPFQAGEINAGRGNSLRVGPHVLCRPLPSPGYVDCYLAREIESRQMVRLAVAHPSDEGREGLASRLEALVGKGKPLDSQVLAPLTRVGVDGGRVWAASRHVTGRTAAEWLVRAGRFPPQLVLEIARQMLAGLTLLEQAGLCHGDIGASTLLLTGDGDIVLLDPGLRETVHPKEGYADADLAPEAYDYLAPERIAHGTPPSTASDVYACGCLWWHLLTGRPPVPGGSALAKMRAVQTARIPSVRLLAPETPGPLAAAISASIQREPSLRPGSMAQLVEILGPPTRGNKIALRRYLSRPGSHPAPWAPLSPRARESRPTPTWMAATAGCLVGALAVAWSIGHTGRPSPAASIPSPPPKVIAEPPADAAQPASAETTSDPSEEAASENRPDDLVLPEGSPLAIESLELRPGQCVRGEPGCRPLILVPYAGLLIRPEGVRFENVDFVWDDAAEPVRAPEAEPAIIHVVTGRAEFRGCSFQAAKTATHAPVAIRWTDPADRSRAELSLISGRLQLGDCVLRQVGVGVSCETLGARAVEMANVLHLGTGPLVQLDHCPNADEPLLVVLSNVTLRNAGPLLECRYEQIADQPGGISIQASGCALVTQPDSALLSFAGPGQPDRMLGKIRWTGQGSLVLPDAIIAGWRPPGGELQVLDDALVSIAGLVRSKVEFAAAAAAGPAASRVLRWQVPLRSPNPPGIDPQTLAWPGP